MPYLCVIFQIRYKRLELLQHPLVESFLFHKFWVVTFPLFLVYLMLYIIFLFVFMYFVHSLPRPGPDSETCKIFTIECYYSTLCFAYVTCWIYHTAIVFMLQRIKDWMVGRPGMRSLRQIQQKFSTYSLQTVLMQLLILSKKASSLQIRMMELLVHYFFDCSHEVSIITCRSREFYCYMFL